MSDELRECIEQECGDVTDPENQVRAIARVKNRQSSLRNSNEFQAHSVTMDMEHIQLMNMYTHPDSEQMANAQPFLADWEVKEVRGSLINSRQGRQHPRDIRGNLYTRARNSSLGPEYGPLVHNLVDPYDPQYSDYKPLALHDIPYAKPGSHQTHDEFEEDHLCLPQRRGAQPRWMRC